MKPGDTPATAAASFTLQGAGVSGGIAIGHAHLVSTARLEVAHYEIPSQEIDAEIARFDRAIAQVEGELSALQANMPPGAPLEMKAILNLHAMLLKDSALSAVPRELIRSRRCNAEWALTQQLDYLVSQFEEMEDPYLRERKQDVVQVVERVLAAMLGTGHAPAAPSHEEDLIVVAHDLSPADMILFKQHRYAGFVTDLGGVTSHTAILARSLALPAIVGLHHARGMIREGETLIVDGREGVLIVNPGERVLAEYRERARRIESEREKLKRLRSSRSATLDGVAVELQANIELPQDVEEAAEAGAMGIGLFRRVVDRSTPAWFELANFGGLGDGGSMAFRRAAFDVWPGFDERLGRGAALDASEEHYAFFCLLDRGYRAVFTPEAIGHHPLPRTLADMRTRCLRDLTASTAYFTFLFVEQPRYRWRVLKYVLEAMRNKQRKWRGDTGSDSRHPVPWWRGLRACLSGPLLYAKLRLFDSRGKDAQARRGTVVEPRPVLASTIPPLRGTGRGAIVDSQLERPGLPAQ